MKESSIDYLLNEIFGDAKFQKIWDKQIKIAKKIHKDEIKEALIDGAINQRTIEFRIKHYYKTTFKK